MSRRVYLGLTLVLVLAGGTLLWWVFTGPNTTPPSQHSIGGLQDTVSIGWTPQHTAVIDAPQPADALTALGYVHGMTRPWTVTVWRRTALGTLSVTFGEGLVPLDQHARRLGFAHHARQAYDRLPIATRKRLQAYTRGINAALQSNRIRRRTPFVYLNTTPNRWEPWHPLAIERLLAWTGTDFSSIPDSAGLSGFRRADRRLRRWLHLHGRKRSIAWAAQPAADTARTALFVRQVLGATAEPMIQEVVLRQSGSRRTVMASLPGTLLFPTGTTGHQAWSYLLGSRARLDRVAVDTARLRTRHERISPTGGKERLVEVERYDRGLLLSTPSPDSAWVVRWPGFRAWSDLPTWTAVANLRPPRPPSDSATFRLFQGSGLTVDTAGTWTVRGQPTVVERGPETVLVGRSSWAQHQAEALRAHRAAGPLHPARWSRSDSSTWAGALLPRMLPDLAPLSGTDPILTDALSYLRNWDHIYEPASIGAVLFDQWMRAYRTEIGRAPVASDSARMAGPRLRRTFRQAVALLAKRYGTDVRRWRWERVAPDRRYFPVWSADSLSRQLSGLSPLNTTRFAPLDRPGRGHASTLAGGPTLVDPLPIGPAPTHWDGWMRADSSGLTVRRLRFDPSAFFARSFLSRRLPAPVSVSQAPIPETTHLVPSND